MGLFKTNKPLSPIFEGYVDYHCHILPGVDDGFRTMESTLHCLETYKQAGVKEVWFTPHIMEDVPNTPEKLRARFEEVKAAYDGPIVLHLAAENMMDSLLEERLDKQDILPLGDDSILVETSCFNPPFNMDGILRRIKSMGYYPVLAHPERYVYMDDARYKQLRNEGVRFQLNVASLVGVYGGTAKSKAEKLLKEGYYTYTGTDLHREGIFQTLLESKVEKSIYARLEQIVLANK